MHTLFTLAGLEKFAPSIVFLDEIDAVASTRGKRTEHDADRRLKSVLFSEMDGIVSGQKHTIMVLATTNRPWDIDEAMRRRLEKRIYVGLPNSDTRKEMLRLHVDVEKEGKEGKERELDSDTLDLDTLAVATEGYSGADIRLLCREAAMMPMRRLLEGKSTEELMALKQSGQLEAVGSMTQGDFEEALKNTTSSVNLDAKSLNHFRNWEKEFGSK